MRTRGKSAREKRCRVHQGGSITHQIQKKAHLKLNRSDEGSCWRYAGDAALRRGGAPPAVPNGGDQHLFHLSTLLKAASKRRSHIRSPSSARSVDGKHTRIGCTSCCTAIMGNLASR